MLIAFLSRLFRKPPPPPSSPRFWIIEPITRDDLNEAIQPTEQILQLRIELDDISPLIWRQVAVPDAIPLNKLHSVIQAAMGWKNCHSYEFKIGHHPVPKQASLLQLVDYAQVHGKPLYYTYDFGDCWQHRIEFELILDPETVPYLPICLDGANACPPEDVGGSAGYANFLATLANPRDVDYQSMLDWCGGGFDAVAYDRNASNRRLKRIKAIPPR